jgi:NAD-dependent deacetylase
MDLKPVNFKRIVILTGAGISADSGIVTYRDAGGLWDKYKLEEVATPEAYAAAPQFVWKFYSMRRLEAARVQPNLAHHALVTFATDHPNIHVTLVTQNVDTLHDRADEHQKLSLISMHGSLNHSRCTQCETVYLDDMAYFDLEGNYAPQETVLLTHEQKASQLYLHSYDLVYRNFLPLSPCCQAPIRPHIVWFGEVPLNMDKIVGHIRKTDLFVSIGTSGAVYPAAGFMELAKSLGATTVCLNKEEIPQLPWVDEFISGKAVEEVPKFFAR